MENRKAGPRSGFVKGTFSLRPEQLEALLSQAKERADKAGRFRPDASEIVREAIDAWLAKRAR